MTAWVTPMVLEKTPLVPQEDQICPPFEIESIMVAVKKGREVLLNSKDMARPDADCWFCVKIVFHNHRKSGLANRDTIVTNGEEFWRAKHDLGESSFILNQCSAQYINVGITQFLG